MMKDIKTTLVIISLMVLVIAVYLVESVIDLSLRAVSKRYREEAKALSPMMVSRYRF